jgi:hypothetical protein
MSGSEWRQKLKDLHTGNKICEGVSNFKYSGNVIDNENKISSCVMERIQAGNKEYYANLHLLKSKLISRNNKKKNRYIKHWYDQWWHMAGKHEL